LKKISKKISKFKRKYTKKEYMRFRRRLYTRGGSHETTVPKPLLFALDDGQKHDVIFEFDQETGRWYLDFQKRE
jgi:hypothetical protein